MGRSQRHQVHIQGASSTGEVYAQGEIAPGLLVQAEPEPPPEGRLADKAVTPQAVEDIVIPIGPPGGPLQGSSLTGPIPGSIAPPPVGDPAPTVESIAPTSAPIQSGDVTMTITGTGFTEETIVVWNGADDTSTFVSETEITTVIKTDMAAVPSTCTVAVRNGDLVSNEVNFLLTDAEAPPPPPPATRSFPIGPIPISRIEFIEGMAGVVVLLEAGPLLVKLMERDSIRIEATGSSAINGDYEIPDINWYPNGVASFFIAGVDIDHVIEGRGRITILAGG